MLQLHQVRDLLPAGHALELDDEQLLVRCNWCGWELVCPCGRFAPAEVLERVFHHAVSCERRPRYAR